MFKKSFDQISPSKSYDSNILRGNITVFNQYNDNNKSPTRLPSIYERNKPSERTEIAKMERNEEEAAAEEVAPIINTSDSKGTKKKAEKKFYKFAQTNSAQMENICKKLSINKSELSPFYKQINEAIFDPEDSSYYSPRINKQLPQKKI